MFFSQTFISFLGRLGVWRIRQLGLALPKASFAVVLDRLIGTAVTTHCCSQLFRGCSAAVRAGRSR
jgi:hypothetical protein